MSIVETARDIGPNFKRNYSPKSCVECHEEFIPTSGTQKFDSVCEPIVRARRRRVRYQTDGTFKRKLLDSNRQSELRRLREEPRTAVLRIPKVPEETKISADLQVEIVNGDTLEVEKSFADVAKKLQVRKYVKLMPVFKEGENQDGVQVYFSPKGYLCYKPMDKEFKIETDVATDVYGREKILHSLASAVALRGI